MGRSHRSLSENDDAKKVYLHLRDAARGAGQRIAEGRALANIARVRTSNYQLQKAQEAAIEALEVADLTQDASLLTFVLLMAELRTAQSNFHEAIDLSQEARAIARHGVIAQQDR